MFLKINQDYNGIYYIYSYRYTPFYGSIVLRRLIVTAGVVEVDDTSLTDSEQLVIINRVDITVAKITVFFIFVTPL